MGCCCSKKDFTDVKQATGMSDKEVKDSYKGFKKEAGGKKIKIDKFTKLVASMNIHRAGNVDEYAKHLFRVLDTDKDNQVSFQEVMVGFHNLSQAGDEKEKMKLVFQMYDIDGNKVLDAHNVKIITKAQYQLEGKPLIEDEINEKVKNCFNQCDLNCDGRITEEEFYKAGKSIAEMFELEGELEEE